MLDRQKAIIFGTGNDATDVLNRAKDDYDIIAFIDNDKEKYGNHFGNGGCYKIYSPDDIDKFDYSKIIIGSTRFSSEMIAQLVDRGIKAENIETRYLLQSKYFDSKEKLSVNEMPESLKRGWLSPYQFAQKILRSGDVASFDIFDTLILRKLDDPVDVFMIVGERLGIYDFCEIRKKAEKDVRDDNYIRKGVRETNINEIYEKVSYITGIERDLGVKTELEVEYEMCIANPFMLEAYKIIRTLGKKIYITSNMYIPSAHMTKLLKHCGYYDFEKVLVSCDYNKSKTDGTLFEILKEMVGSDKKIVHIGDNLISDIKGAKKAGVESIYYPSCRELGNNSRSHNMSQLVGSAYRAVINNTLYNGADRFSRDWEYGFVYGGIIAIGYARYIHEECLKNNISKVLFISHDGYIIKKIFDYLFEDFATEYILWSSLSSAKCINDRQKNIAWALVGKEQCDCDIRIGDVLSRLGISQTDVDMKCELLPVYDVLNKDNIDKLNRWLDVNERSLNIKRAKNRENGCRYIRGVIGNHQSIAVVNIGWSGLSMAPLFSLIESEGKVKATGFLLGSKMVDQDMPYILSEKIKCYMFSEKHNRDIYEKICDKKVPGLEIMEKLFGTYHPGFDGFGDFDKLNFIAPDVDDYEHIREIENGILDFCRIYRSYFYKQEYLFNISGCDAFRPIEKLIGTESKYINTLDN